MLKPSSPGVQSSLTIVTLNVLKVSQSRGMIDRFCQDEGFELIYHIETLIPNVKCLPYWKQKKYVIFMFDT